jgi:hypothetical protein
MPVGNAGEPHYCIPAYIMIVDVPAGPGLLGHIVDALGNLGPIQTTEPRHTSLKVLGILPHRSANRSLPASDCTK